MYFLHRFQNNDKSRTKQHFWEENQKTYKNVNFSKAAPWNQSLCLILFAEKSRESEKEIPANFWNPLPIIASIEIGQIQLARQQWKQQIFFQQQSILEKDDDWKHQYSIPLWKVCSGLSFSMGTLWNLCPTSFCRFQKQLLAVLVFYFGFIFCFEGWPLVLNLYFVSFPVFCFEPLWFECWPLVGDNLWPNGETDGGTALDFPTSGCLSINNTRPNHKHWGICQQTTNSGEIIKQRLFFQNLILITRSPFYSSELCCNVESWCDLCLCHCRCLCHCHHCLFIFVIAIVFLLIKIKILIIIMITSFPFHSSELCWITSRRQVGKFKVKQGTRLPRKVPIFFFLKMILLSAWLYIPFCVWAHDWKRDCGGNWFPCVV